MKTLGILGGVGPQTTAKVYLSIIDLVRKGGGEAYPPIVIYNLPFPFVIEDEAIVQGRNSEKMILYLIEGAKILEKAGASFGILPCNTLHKYIKEIRESVKMPFLSILDESARELTLRKVQKVGVLATQTTIESDIYGKVLKESGIEVLYPQADEQRRINNVIIELLDGRQGTHHGKEIENLCYSLSDNGAESILLACTDLQLAISNVHSPIPILDTTDILIRASVRELRGK